MRFELEFECAFQAIGLPEVIAPPVVDVRDKAAANLARIGLRPCAAQPHERGIRVAVDHLVAARFDQRPRLLHDLVPSHRDRRGEPRIEESATAGPEHAVERIHDDLERLGKRLVLVALGGFAPLPDFGDDGGQAVLRPGKPSTAEAGYRIGVVGMCQPLDQTDRVDQEGADDRWIKALVVQHEHRLVEPWSRIHDEAARAGLRRRFTQIRCDVALTVHQRHVEMRKRRDRATAAIGRQTRYRGALQQERQQLRLLEDARHQFAIVQVIAGQRRLVLLEHAVDGVHAVVGVVDRLAFAEQRLRTDSRLNDGKLHVAERSASMPSMISRPGALAK